MFSANGDVEYRWRKRGVRMRNLQRLPLRKSQKHNLQKKIRTPRPAAKKTESIKDNYDIVAKFFRYIKSVISH